MYLKHETDARICAKDVARLGNLYVLRMEETTSVCGLQLAALDRNPPFSGARKQKTMTRIVHLSSAHQALDHRIFYKEARFAARAGYDVVVIAKHSTAETKEGVRISPLKNKKNRFARMLLSPFSILQAALAEAGDIYQFHDPELIPLGLVLKILGKQVIYDVHEITTEQLMLKEWLPKWLRKPVSKIFSAFERFAMPHFDGISVPQIYMETLFKPYAKRVALTRNFADLDEIEVSYPDQGGGNLLLYAGAMSRPRGFLNMVRAMGKIRSNACLILAGDCDAQLLMEAKQDPGWANIVYMPHMPFSEISALYRKSSIGLILYDNAGQYPIALAVKLFEYLAWGMPVVMPNFGDWIAFNAEARCGINVNTSNCDEVAAAIDELLEHPKLRWEMGRNGREIAEKKYSWSNEARNLIRIYQELEGKRAAIE